MRLNNAWPLRIIVEDSQFFDNGAFVGVVINGLLYCNIRSDNLMYGADSKFHMIRSVISHRDSAHHTGIIVNGFGVNACMDARDDAFMDILHQDVLVTRDQGITSSAAMLRPASPIRTVYRR